MKFVTLGKLLVGVSKMAKPLKIEKDKFDAILGRLLKTPTIKRSEIKTAKKKPAKLIKPSRDSQQ